VQRHAQRDIEQRMNPRRCLFRRTGAAESCARAGLDTEGRVVMIVTRRTFTKLVLAASASLPIARPTFARTDPGCHFFVLGDWGHKNSDGQRRVAKAMSDIASTKPPRFVISTGDNFYGRGVPSDTDDLWAEAFENVYSAEALKCPWYTVLGNHDYKGNVDAQIAYARRNPRWVLPSRYYQHVEPVGASSRIEFFFLDTMQLVSTRPRLWTKWIDGADPNLQIDWLEQSLRNSSAQWKIVVGHHPIVSAGPHLASPPLVKLVKPLLETYGVQVYFSGHEHNLQHHVTAGIHYLISGAGSRVRVVRRTEQALFSASQLGFIRAVASPNALEIEFIDDDAQVIHASRISIG
jgi:tartrate-resistant acid phosphatase type 5